MTATLRPLHAGLAAAALVLGSAAGAAAADLPAYRDNRSTPEAVVESLYNAVERREWLRAWSYFREDAAPPYRAFAAGYADTKHVRLKLGKASSEGAAGSIYTRVPAVVEAETASGTAVYAGCYELRLVQPAAQDEPPFRPLAITGAALRKVAESFEIASGRCDGEGAP